MKTTLSPQAAVALIFTQNESQNAVLLIERSVDPSDPWSGHLSFPGGRIEPGEKPFDAAIRETYEEVGIALDPQHYASPLPMGTAGRPQKHPILIQPFRFHIPHRVETVLNPAEVARTLWLPLDDFTNISKHDMQSGLSPQFPEMSFPCFRVGSNVLWGFSYRCLRDAIGILGAPKDPDIEREP